MKGSLRWLTAVRANSGTIEETETEIRSAVAFHIEGLIEDGLPIPPSTARAHSVEIATMLPRLALSS